VTYEAGSFVAFTEQGSARGGVVVALSGESATVCDPDGKHHSLPVTKLTPIDEGNILYTGVGAALRERRRTAIVRRGRRA
jgi:hypothetical protein